jgi:DNA polymerase-4
MAAAEPRRWIAHLDMDAFYASVELLRYPELQGQPVVIGGGRRHQPETLPEGGRRFATLGAYKGRGVVTTATYPARDLGVHSGMGLMKAAQRAPQAVLLPTDFDRYRLYSRRFKTAVAEIAPMIEDRGIDEIYIDLSAVPGAQDAVGHDPFGGVRAVAQEIRNNVRSATGLSCSIGVTPNKLLAKIASELDKPDGLTVLVLDDLPRRIWPMPVRRINGIGPKAGAQLEALGIRTIGDLAAVEPAVLTERFGRSYGRWLADAAHGRDDRPLATGGDLAGDHLHRRPASSPASRTWPSAACRACSTTMPTAGSWTESTYRANESDFAGHQTAPARGGEHGKPQHRHHHGGPGREAMPVAIAPTGLTGMQHADGEIHAARAAEKFGIPFTLSTMSICSIEDIAAQHTAAPFWFQLYMMRDRDFIGA